MEILLLTGVLHIKLTYNITKRVKLQAVFSMAEGFSGNFGEK
jgi:hypothetical protein